MAGRIAITGRCCGRDHGDTVLLRSGNGESAQLPNLPAPPPAAPVVPLPESTHEVGALARRPDFPVTGWPTAASGSPLVATQTGIAPRFSLGGQPYPGIMRTTFHTQLAELATGLSDMCARAGAAMNTATQALLQADLVLAENVIAGHHHLTAMRSRVEENAVVLLALQAPVARDLRTVVSALHHAADIERMGGLATHVAKVVRRRHPEHVLPDEVSDSFADMGHLAMELANNAHDVLTTADAGQAARIRHGDDAMDALHRHLFTVLMDHQWTHGVAAAVDVTLLGRFYERFADHTVEIARRVIFARTGHLPDDETLRTAAP